MNTHVRYHIPRCTSDIRDQEKVQFPFCHEILWNPSRFFVIIHFIKAWCPPPKRPKHSPFYEIRPNHTHISQFGSKNTPCTPNTTSCRLGQESNSSGQPNLAILQSL